MIPPIVCQFITIGYDNDYTHLSINYQPLCECRTLSSRQSATRLIPQIWCPYQVNPWEIASSVPQVTWITNEDMLIL